MEVLGRRTLLFTDIEGSTALLQRVGHPQFVELMDQHHQIMRTAIKNNNGEEIQNEGDAFVVLFPTPLSGLNCAVESQKAFRTGPWPDGAEISVRMGLHEGEIGFSESGHHGIALHEAARVSSAAHGGQVLLSDVARTSIADALPENSKLRLKDLGTFALKDIGPHVPLIQVTHPDLEENFPSPRGSGGGQNNLPAQLTSLVGRAAEAAEVDALVQTHRLTTLLGSGGVGKTRLALRVAANLSPQFFDGVWLVELAAVGNPEQVLDEIRRAMRIPDDGQGNQTLIDAIQSYNALIILDNCEHLLDGVAGAVETILRECPDVRVLATSREPIGTQGEVQWRVPSLPTADAVDLLTERARLVAPHLVVSPTDRTILEHVCQRLDGIPLAIELVAGRLGTIPIGEIESRLLNKLRLLSTGARGQLPRHKTLRAALDWSYQLLSPAEQLLLKRLAIFPGPLELPAAETICAGGIIDELDVLDLLESLHLKSLISMDWPRKPPLATRSEIISQFAETILDETDERPELARKHATYFFAFSKDALDAIRKTDRIIWMDRIENDRENLGAAYDWLAEHQPDDAATMLVNLKEWLIASVSTAWITRVRELSVRTDISERSIAVSNALRSMLSGFYSFESPMVAAETSRLALQHLDAVTDPHDRIRVLTNLAAGFREADPPMATTMTEQAVAEAETLGEESDLVVAMLDLLVVHDEHHPVSRRLRTTVLTLMENNVWSSVHPLVDGALAMHQMGDHGPAIQALTHAENMLPRVPQTGGLMTEDAKVWTIWSVLIRAEVGDTETAILLAEDGLKAFGETNILYTKTLTSNYGQALLVAGRVEEARGAFESTLKLQNIERYVAYAIASLGVARVDLHQGNPQAAYDRMLILATENHRAWVRARAHYLLADASLALGHNEDASEHVRLADELRSERGFAVPPAFRADADRIRRALT